MAQPARGMPAVMFLCSGLQWLSPETRWLSCDTGLHIRWWDLYNTQAQRLVCLSILEEEETFSHLNSLFLKIFYSPFVAPTTFDIRYPKVVDLPKSVCPVAAMLMSLFLSHFGFDSVVVFRLVFWQQTHCKKLTWSFFSAHPWISQPWSLALHRSPWFLAPSLS